MTERDHLIRAILADPADNTVRLAYADFLDEHGEHERAEFIRCQIEVASPYGHSTDAKRRHATSRARELWESVASGAPCTNGYTWTQPLGDLFGEHLSSVNTPFALGSFDESTLWACRRGFVSRVSCTQADFLTHAEAIFRAHPVTAVTLSDREPVAPYGPDGIAEWYKERPDSSLANYKIHGHLFDLLPDGKRVVASVDSVTENPVGWCCVFPSRDVAHAALSAACVAYARALPGVGLPALNAASVTAATSQGSG